MRAGTINHVMALTNSALATARNSTNRPVGTIIAPPILWTIRARTRVIRPLDKPHKTDPQVNSAMAEQNTLRDLNRSATQPLTGMKTARLSR